MLQIPFEMFRRFNAINGWIMCSHVAMSMMLALFPFIVFLVALSGLMTRDLDHDELIALTLGSWPEAVSNPIKQELHNVVAGGTGGLVSVGMVLTLVFASNGVIAVGQAMAMAYRVADQRRFWHKRLVALTFVIAGAVLIVVFAFLGVAMPIYLRFIDNTSHWLYSMLVESHVPRILIGLVVAALVVSACHWFLPGGNPRQRKLWPGVAMTVITWVVAANGFSIYLARFATYSATYAGLAGAMVALIFLYLMSAILILGAELNCVLGEREAPADA